MKYIRIHIVLVTLLLIGACAQQGAPSGGPQDEDPPRLLKAEPANYSTNFSSNKIMMTFDEYLDMGNFAQELIVSPPMEEKPIVKLRNKTLIIEFDEELKEDVTYTFNFGEGIKDLNEKNVLLNFEYVFSTGDYLDSLSIKGMLRNAFDLSIPEGPMSIMLYNELNDSLPLQDIPYYVGRSDKEGNFAVNNLRKGIYKMFILKDGNNNFLFDLPTEEIAFLDSSIMVDADYFRDILLLSGTYDSSDLLPDTMALSVDTSGMSPDSILMVLDSLEQLKPDFNSVFVDLFMFVEDPENRYLSDYSRSERRKLDLLFSLPLTDSFDYKPLFPLSLNKEDLIPEFGMKRDSLSIWLRDTLIAAHDTIVLALDYTGKDSLGLDILIQDTLQFTYRETNQKGRKESETDKKGESLLISGMKNQGTQHLYRDLAFDLNFPLKSLDPSLFSFFIIPDTIEMPLSIEPFADSTHLRRMKIKHKWKEDSRYRLQMLPGAIRDIYGSINDTIDLKFTAKSLTDYGKIILTIENLEDSVLVELYKKANFYKNLLITENGTYTFEFLDPDTYRLKFVFDRNGNKEWDTGKYMEHLQPERVEFFPQDIKVRANWDHEVSYVIGSGNEPPAAEKTEEQPERAPRF